MAVFAIMSEISQPELRAAIEKNHAGNFYHWTDRISFVTAAGGAAAISTALGIKNDTEEGVVSGTIDSAIVTQLAPSYWGWTGAEFWAWLSAAFEKDGK